MHTRFYARVLRVEGSDLALQSADKEKRTDSKLREAWQQADPHRFPIKIFCSPPLSGLGFTFSLDFCSVFIMSDQLATEREMASSESEQKAGTFSAVSLEDENSGTGIPGVPLENTEVFETSPPAVGAAFQRLRSMTETRLRCTKQLLSERFGKGTRTVDVTLDERITALRETQRKYILMVNLVRKLSVQLKASMETQQSLGETFAEYSVHIPELSEEFKRNSDIQRHVARNGESLLAILSTFEGNLETLSRKTIEDTMQKVKEYESARVEYDAFRTDLEQLRANKAQNPGNTGKAAKLDKAEADFEVHRSRYDKMRSELMIKLQLLDENKVSAS